jgi:hypothetical protein
VTPRIRRAALAVLAPLAACDDPGAGTGLLDSATGAPTDTGPAPTTKGATQLGSEGFWGCPVLGLDPVSPVDAIPGLGVPQDLAAAALGDWSGTWTSRADGAITDGKLASVATSFALARSAAPCDDHLVVGVSASVARASVALPTTGWLGLRPGDAALLLTADGTADEAAVAWGLADPQGLAALRWRLDVVDGALGGVASFVDCGPSEVACADAVDVLDGAFTR